MRRPYGVEQADERGLLIPRQAFHGRAAARQDWRVQPGEQVGPLLRDPAEVLAPVVWAALAAHQALGLEAVQQARDAGRLLDHPIPDFERGQPVGPGQAGAPQDPQHVELLHGDPDRIDDRGRPPAQEVGRSHHRHHPVVGHGSPRPPRPAAPLPRCRRHENRLPINSCHVKYFQRRTSRTVDRAAPYSALSTAVTSVLSKTLSEALRSRASTRPSSTSCHDAARAGR